MTLETPNTSAQKNARGDLAAMDALDTMVPGGKLPADIEREYRHIIDEHERLSSPLDRAVAMSARLRLLEHQYKAKQQQRCVESLTTIMQKYPELCRQMRILAIAAEVHAADSPAFVTAFENAGGASLT